MISELQMSRFRALDRAIRKATTAEEINGIRSALKIDTPFLDWKGCPVCIYVDENGMVTDGGGTINELIALRCLEKFESWKFKEDYFNRYGIWRKGNRLHPTNTDSGEALLSYVQGISRIPGFFKANPIKGKRDRKPQKETTTK